jgi:hypothetical protein
VERRLRDTDRLSDVSGAAAMTEGPQMPEWIGLVKSHELGMTMEQLAYHRAAYWEAVSRLAVGVLHEISGYAGTKAMLDSAKSTIKAIGPLPPEHPRD